MPDPTGRVSHLPEMHRGVAWKEPCRVATTANVTISTALNNGDSLDGVTLATGDRVLVKDQSTGSQNGIYVVGASPARAYDMDQDATTSVPASEVMGAFIYVIAGTANGGKVFYATNTTPPVIGTDSITFTQLSSGGGSVATDTIWDNKGDLAAATGADAAVAVPVGANDTILMADSAQTAGLKWVAPATPSTQAFGDAAAAGSADTFTRGDHKHGMPAAPTTIANDTIWAAKGDLAAATANDAASVLTVGSNDTILMADSGQSTGLKWVASQTPSTQAFGDAAAEGTADTYARGDHKHGMPTGSAVMVAYPLNSQTLDGTYGDDFDEASLNARWSGQNLTSGDMTFQVGPRASALQILFPNTTAGRYIYQTDPNNTNETWEVNFTLWQRVATGNMFGLCQLDSSGDGVAAMFYDNTAGLYLMTITGHVQTGIAAQTTPYNFGEYRAGQQIWLKLVKASNVFTAYGSTDGECYVPVGPSATSTTTKSRVGVGRFLGTTANSYLLIHRFNKTA